LSVPEETSKGFSEGFPHTLQQRQTQLKIIIYLVPLRAGPAALYFGISVERALSWLFYSGSEAVYLRAE
jgi:hypothetical protein